MAPNPIDAALQAALDGNLRRLKKKAKEVNLREAKDDRGRNALHFAAAMGRLGTCEYLVDEVGIGANSLSGDGETPVLLAAAEGKVPVLAFLLGRGVTRPSPTQGAPRRCTRRQSTVRSSSITRRLSYIFAYMYKVSVRLCMSLTYYCVIMSFMPLLGHDEAVRLLLSKGVDVDPLNYKGTPLHLAANKDQEQVVKVLLEHGANVPQHSSCQSRLHTAHDSMLRALLEMCKATGSGQAGADVNFKTSRGPTALLMAVDEGLIDIVKFLIEAGADPNIADHRGRIPIIYAAAYKQREIVETLFPTTKPVSSLQGWSVDGIITAMRKIPLEDKVTYTLKEHIDFLKSQGKQAYAKQDYLQAINFYTQAIEEDPGDATLFANRSLCWLQMRDGDRALLDAQQCKAMRPSWSMEWYREGTALSLLKNYREAADSFVQALKCDKHRASTTPASDMINKALREAIDAMKSGAGTEGQNPVSESTATVDISHDNNSPEHSTERLHNEQAQLVLQRLNKLAM
ncbi:hypothetical protein EJB05_00577 [Eragrostis curvula]|uniref:Serine/threonine-protein kinase BSK1-like TPR repeats domain-containing protein n=1 Tax=Eragrostis curvula TaxID=38414 RepID=A0A5J9WMD7_9POAL|nr:hypothetical protein EJB05_00577 [Eragrostis curvula]